MKIKRILSLAFVCFLAKGLTAQIDVPGDSLKNMLCHKWGFKAIIMGGQRLTNMNESVTYEFLVDGTFKRISSNKKVENGTWIFKLDQKIISLKIKKTVLHIASLSVDELMVAPGEGMNETKNDFGMGTVLQPID